MRFFNNGYHDSTLTGIYPGEHAESLKASNVLLKSRSLNILLMAGIDYLLGLCRM